MSDRTFWLSDAVHDYVVGHSTAPDAVQSDLIEVTRALGDVSIMQISPEQGALMGVLVGALGPRLAIEIGTFTGYSALAIARALPPDGRLICCDVSEEWTSIGQRHWRAAGVDDRIDLRIGPALDTLESLGDVTVDFAFVDADKESYPAYYEWLLPRLSERGIIAVDNTLWDGRVADPDAGDDTTEAIRSFNDRVAADPRAQVALVPIGDGLTLIRRTYRGDGPRVTRSPSPPTARRARRPRGWARRR